jgi:quercetin dioxygenase-like cupin family protein
MVSVTFVAFHERAVCGVIDTYMKHDIKESGMQEPTPPGATPFIPIPPTVVAAGASTGGDYALATLMLPPYDTGAPLHTHPSYTEGCYVLSGTLAVTYDQRTITLTQGTSICVPPGVAHTCWNPTATPTTVLLIYQPGGEAHDVAALAACVACETVVYVEAS